MTKLNTEKERKNGAQEGCIRQVYTGRARCELGAMYTLGDQRTEWNGYTFFSNI